MCWKSTWQIESDGSECVAASLRAIELGRKLSVADEACVEGDVYVRNSHACNVVKKRCAG